MIPVELVLLLINELEAHGVAMVKNPIGRDGFALGEAHGWMRCTAHFEERLKAMIEDTAENDPVDRPISSSGNNNNREYSF